MRKFLCFIGWHAWTYHDREHRQCVHCKRREVAEVDDFWCRLDWVKDE